MFERARAKYREQNRPRDVTFTLSNGVARDIFAFHARFGRINGSVAWVGLLVCGYAGMFMVIGAILGALVDPSSVIIAGTVIGFACMSTLVVIPWHVRRMIKA